MVMRTIGAGSKYPFTPRDSKGRTLNGSHTYKLNIPEDVPAKLFWATTAYKITDGSMPETDQLFPSKNSLGDTVANKDGTIDMWNGPAKPDGVAETNFIKTVEGRDFLICFRQNGADIDFYDETWKLNDVERVK